MLLLRVYTEYIPAGDMGTYNVSINYITFLCSVLYLDIWSGILRYFYDYHTPEGQKKPINCGSCNFRHLNAPLYGDHRCVRPVCAGTVSAADLSVRRLMMNLQNLLGTWREPTEKNVLYASAGLLNSFVTAVMNIVLIVGLHMDYSALYLAGCLGYLSNIILIGIGVRLWTLIRPFALRRRCFSDVPFFPSPVCELRRLLVSDQLQQCGGHRMLGMEANGLYAVATRFGSFVSLFTSCFPMAWQEVSYAEEADGRDSRSQFYSNAVNAYLRFMGWARRS